MSERTDKGELKREKDRRGMETSCGCGEVERARDLGKGRGGEGRLDTERFHLIFEIHLWVARAWALSGSGLCGTGSILAKGVLERKYLSLL